MLKETEIFKEEIAKIPLKEGEKVSLTKLNWKGEVKLGIPDLNVNAYIYKGEIVFECIQHE